MCGNLKRKRLPPPSISTPKMSSRNREKIVGNQNSSATDSDVSTEIRSSNKKGKGRPHFFRFFGRIFPSSTIVRVNKETRTLFSFLDKQFLRWCFFSLRMMASVSFLGSSVIHWKCSMGRCGFIEFVEDVLFFLSYSHFDVPELGYAIQVEFQGPT